MEQAPTGLFNMEQAPTPVSAAFFALIVLLSDATVCRKVLAIQQISGAGLFSKQEGQWYDSVISVVKN
jgi:hypothetical protein